MTRAAAIQLALEIEASGTLITSDGQSLILDGPGALNPQFRGRVAALKPDLIGLLSVSPVHDHSNENDPHDPHDPFTNKFVISSTVTTADKELGFLTSGSCGTSVTPSSKPPTATNVLVLASEASVNQARQGDLICAASLPDGRIVDWRYGTAPDSIGQLLAEEIVVVSLGGPPPRGGQRTRLVDAARLARLAQLPTEPAALAAAVLGTEISRRFSPTRVQSSLGSSPESRRAQVRLDVARLRRVWDRYLGAFDRVEPEVRAADTSINGRGFAFDRRLAEAVAWCDHEWGEQSRRNAVAWRDEVSSPERLRASLE